MSLPDKSWCVLWLPFLSKFLAFPVLHSCLNFFFFWNLLCFVLPLIFFPQILVQICETIIFWTLKHFQVIYQSHFFFQISLPPCFILLFQSGLITVAFSGLPFSFSPVLDFQFPRSSVVFSEAHILITWWLNYVVLGCLKTCLYYFFYIYNL